MLCSHGKLHRVKYLYFRPSTSLYRRPRYHEDPKENSEMSKTMGTSIIPRPYLPPRPSHYPRHHPNAKLDPVSNEACPPSQNASHSVPYQPLTCLPMASPS